MQGQTREKVGRVHRVGWETDLGLHMVSHIMGCAAQRDLPDGPWGIVGQVSRQNTDPQLTLGVRVSEACDSQGHDADAGH